MMKFTSLCLGKKQLQNNSTAYDAPGLFINVAIAHNLKPLHTPTKDIRYMKISRLLYKYFGVGFRSEMCPMLCQINIDNLKIVGTSTKEIQNFML